MKLFSPVRCRKSLRYGLEQCRFRSSSAIPAETILDQDAIKDELAAARPYSEVPGPKPIPILGNTWRLLPVIGQYQISDVAKISFLLYEMFGKIVALRGLVGRPDLLFVYDADEIEKFYRQEGPTPFRPSMPCLVKYKSEIRKDFFGRLAGIVAVHGESWREFRSKVQKPVLQPQTVKKYIAPIESITDDFITRMSDILDSNQELPSYFDNELHKWSLECIGQIALDVRLGCLNKNLASDSEPQKLIDGAKYALRNIALLELKFPFWRYLPSNLWRNYVRNMDYFVEICMKYINLALDRLKTKDLSREKELSLVERILVSESDTKLACVLALDLILVGIDTVSMATGSILYQLATRPEEQDKIYEELLRVLPNPEEKLTTKKIDELQYLKAFIKEVFRMYSTVIGNGRTVQHDTVISGYKIPKGTQLVFPTLVLGRMPQYFSEPETFKPDRWLKQSSLDNILHPFASLPYGHGPRMCLGRRFADLEMQILISKILRKYKLEYHHELLEYKVTFMFAPDGDLKFRMISR